ncbi:MAG: MmcQ/YjbR family DNA-binding protein [Pseudomonadota bacterium]|nr:MmcQ/YjbR family DNA-binding protein [Pseudomonadota bacterium]
MVRGTRREKDIPTAVREICLSFPGTEETVGHGLPDFKVIGGRIFATLAVNHHGDGRLAMWLRMPVGDQLNYVDAEPEYFYVPPYVGTRGWLGVNLDKGLDWLRVAKLVRGAFVEVAPKKLTANLGATIDITPPTRTIDPIEFDPFVANYAQACLQTIRDVCLAYPETHEDTQFGNPCFRAGKKNFCTLYFRDRKLMLSTWVGSESQAALTFDKRYSIPAYTGHHGWIEINLEEPSMTGEAENLIEASYRHFALKRMHKLLDEQTNLK